MTESKTGMSFSRRNFIKGAAALTATGALVGCAPAKETLAETGEEPVEVPETQIYAGACRAQCGQGCYLNVHVRDGRVVRTTAGHFDDGPEFDRICPKGFVQPARVYSSERLQYPMRRVGERGSGEFERITWDEAIAEIAEKWKSYREEFGPTSIAFFLGSGNTGTLGRRCAGRFCHGPTSERHGVRAGSCRRDIATPMAWAYMFGAGPYGNRSSDASTPNTM